MIKTLVHAPLSFNNGNCTPCLLMVLTTQTSRYICIPVKVTWFAYIILFKTYKLADIVIIKYASARLFNIFSSLVFHNYNIHSFQTLLTSSQKSEDDRMGIVCGACPVTL